MNKKILSVFVLFTVLTLSGCARQAVEPVQEPGQKAPAGDFGLLQGDRSGQVRLKVPVNGAAVISPLTLKGEARGSWFFEAGFPVELRDGNGNLLANALAEAKGDWMTENFVPFEAILKYETTSKEGTLILKKANPSGLPENDDQMSVPVTFGKAAPVTEFKVFFTNETLDPEMSCTKVFPVIRKLCLTGPVSEAAIGELLKGPTETEKGSKYSTAINEGVTLKSLTITDGVATADFDEQLGFQVGGSCRVGLIRKQVEETLKQFPEVKTVKIAINGVSDDTILQP